MNRFDDSYGSPRPTFFGWRLRVNTYKWLLTRGHHEFYWLLRYYIHSIHLAVYKFHRFTKMRLVLSTSPRMCVKARSQNVDFRLFGACSFSCSLVSHDYAHIAQALASSRDSSITRYDKRCHSNPKQICRPRINAQWRERTRLDTWFWGHWTIRAIQLFHRALHVLITNADLFRHNDVLYPQRSSILREFAEILLACILLAWKFVAITLILVEVEMYSRGPWAWLPRLLVIFPTQQSLITRFYVKEWSRSHLFVSGNFCPWNWRVTTGRVIPWAILLSRAWFVVIPNLSL